MIGSEDEQNSFALLDDVLELGCNTFDTAHVYGNGDKERTLGKWIQQRGIREQVVIIGKGAHHNRDRRRVTPFDIASDLHDSLARLKTDYIDLYLLHRDDPSVPVGPIVEALNEHLRAGRIRAFGGSNWTHERIQAANDYARKHRLAPFVASSPNFSLAEQVKEPWPECVSISGAQGAAAREWYIQNQIPVFAWSSLAGGFLSGRFTRNNLDSFTDWQDKLCVDCYCYEDNFKRLDRVRALAAEKGVSVPQIAIAYVLNQPMMVFALVGCRNRSEFQSNVEAASLKLTPREIAWLELRTDTR